MSMAVIDDMPETEAEAPKKPDVLTALWAALKLRYRLKLRLLRRRVLVRIRNLFRIDEDFIRDQVIDGLRRDLAQTADALGHAMAAVNVLNDRLSYHEAHIPRMRTLRREFDKGKRILHAARDERIEHEVEVIKEKQADLANGVLKPLEIVH